MLDVRSDDDRPGGHIRANRGREMMAEIAQIEADL